MTTETNTLDLRQRPADVHPHTYVFYALKELPHGQALEVISDQDPQLLMRQLQHQFRNRLAWEIVDRQPGLWRLSIRDRAETTAVTLADTLSRDHERLDRQFVEIMQALAQQRLDDAARVAGEFNAGLRRHIHVENELLAVTFPPLHPGVESDPTETMLREHDDILRLAGLIEEALHQTPPDTFEADTWCGLLAATLSKHEHREETRLFPQWDINMRQRDDAEMLLDKVRAGLKGPE